MSSPNISLIAIHESKLMEPKAWLSTTWTIYENLRTIINVRYNNNDTKECDYDVVISEDDFNTIIETFERAKLSDRHIFCFRCRYVGLQAVQGRQNLLPTPR